MKSTQNDNQAGVVLVLVLVMLTLFGIVGLTFTYYASETECGHIPNAELRDGICTRTIGNDRR